MRIVVLANETCASPAVIQEVRALAQARDQAVEVMVVAPAIARSRLAHWLNSDHSAQVRAQGRLDDSLAALRSSGLPATGVLGDQDPLQALDDAVRVFRPDAVLISTHPADRSLWQERWVVERARERFDLPITHVTVDLEAERAGAPGAVHVDRPVAGGVPQPSRPVRLHARVGYEEALAIGARGFRDAQVGPRVGIVARDRLGDTDPDDAVFAVDVPEEAIGAYEVGRDSDGARMYVVPAALLNRHGPLVRVDDDTIE